HVRTRPLRADTSQPSQPARPLFYSRPIRMRETVCLAVTQTKKPWDVDTSPRLFACPASMRLHMRLHNRHAVETTRPELFGSPAPEHQPPRAIDHGQRCDEPQHREA